MSEKNNNHIYTVSKLTRQIKSLLEENYPFIWINGEISNIATPSSGHVYFTLKDNQAVIKSVVFKNQNKRLKFTLENGLKIVGLARLSLYEPRGVYQLIFEHMEPQGTGSLQIAFEQLKNRLASKGFFDDKHKKLIPFLPTCVTVISSPTGAAIKDILSISERRFPNCRINVIPVKVQGDDSIEEICSAIEAANRRNDSDLIIIARGGGSLEDLASFNSEEVAYSIFYSEIPVITGVGHETDYTIADFVADLRAPTPSAAAELAWPDKPGLNLSILKSRQALERLMSLKFENSREELAQLTYRIKTPYSIIHDYRFRLEDYENRMYQMVSRYFKYNKEKFEWLQESIENKKPLKKIAESKDQLRLCEIRLTDNLKKIFDQAKNLHFGLINKLETLSPEKVLKRGYSISRSYPEKKLLTDANNVNPNDLVEVILDKGCLITRVEKIGNG